mmetsp:Transcript_38942/g.47455  ORF Transcript_38942/g.47455 Transcript_38942/m.47455 type:complete len:126 (-) Transcript_38942:334-711(-)|eukprot:CAMPEP_0172490424 /NCGR_PEP_ID=MMETSP1066-20121228/20841_1 /TAXON_ID=671091 /ORGANISM="Coscinodiscus wailesii, Strain CCMP2513" /LENGTH=125 /DNA_ID=CAMNT_0013258879 /DNA_START=135 /DNA_END=512 /DNA_ORIENTATION=-
MALGPIGRIIAQGVILGVSILARTIPAAYAQALAKARKDGVKEASEIVKRGGMRKTEALEILNLSETEATAEAIQKQYDRYFQANAVENGGSFYLQSKIYRAKELLDEYIEEKRKEETEEAKMKK